MIRGGNDETTQSSDGRRPRSFVRNDRRSLVPSPAVCGDAAEVCVQHAAGRPLRRHGAWPPVCALLPADPDRLAGTEIVVDDAQADGVAAAIVKSANTGKIGDGKVFISTVEEAIRIRTGETGSSAVAVN